MKILCKFHITTSQLIDYQYRLQSYHAHDWTKKEGISEDISSFFLSTLPIFTLFMRTLHATPESCVSISISLVNLLNTVHPFLLFCVTHSMRFEIEATSFL